MTRIHLLARVIEAPMHAKGLKQWGVHHVRSRTGLSESLNTVSWKRMSRATQCGPVLILACVTQRVDYPLEWLDEVRVAAREQKPHCHWFQPPPHLDRLRGISSCHRRDPRAAPWTEDNQTLVAEVVSARRVSGHDWCAAVGEVSVDDATAVGVPSGEDCVADILGHRAAEAFERKTSASACHGVDS
jgi:hypothetical protein